MEPGWAGEAGKEKKPGFCGKRIELSHREGVWEWEWEGRGGEGHLCSTNKGWFRFSGLL